MADDLLDRARRAAVSPNYWPSGDLGEILVALIARLDAAERPHQIRYTPGDDTTRNPARFDCACGTWWADDAPHGWDHSIIDHLYEGER